MLLLGLFIEDVQMFTIRHPQVSILSLTESILDINMQDKKKLQPYIIGRQLWCISTSIEAFMTKNEQEAQLKNRIVCYAIKVLKEQDIKAVKLIATRTIVRYARKINPDDIESIAKKFESVLDDLLKLIETCNKDVMHLPIQAFQTFSQFSEDTVAQMAPKITPKLLEIFKTEHSEGSLGQELINLFKHWCQFNDCRDIFINTFIPFIIEIVQTYYTNTPNEENRGKQLTLHNIISESSSLDSSLDKQSKSDSATTETDSKVYVDATILMYGLDLLSTLLKKTDKKTHPNEFKKIIELFPSLLNFVHKSDDMFLQLHGTTTLKNFIFYGHQEIL